MTFYDDTNGFPAKGRLRIEHRNCILMTHHYSDLGSASDWMKQISPVISMEFLHSFLRRHFMGKPLVKPQNVVLFLRLL